MGIDFHFAPTFDLADGRVVHLIGSDPDNVYMWNGDGDEVIARINWAETVDHLRSEAGHEMAIHANDIILGGDTWGILDGIEVDYLAYLSGQPTPKSVVHSVFRKYLVVVEPTFKLEDEPTDAWNAWEDVQGWAEFSFILDEDEYRRAETESFDEFWLDWGADELARDEGYDVDELDSLDEDWRATVANNGDLFPENGFAGEYMVTDKLLAALAGIGASKVED